MITLPQHPGERKSRCANRKESVGLEQGQELLWLLSLLRCNFRCKKDKGLLLLFSLLYYVMGTSSESDFVPLVRGSS